MVKPEIIFCVIYLNVVLGNIQVNDEAETRRVQAIVEIIKNNLKTNGWNNILYIGELPDIFYNEIKLFNLTLVSLDVNNEEYDIDDVVPYRPNFIMISCKNFDDLESIITDVVYNPYWHPLANIILYYHSPVEEEELAKIFFILWYHKAANAILVTFDDVEKILKAFYYSPYVSEKSTFPNKYGCWTLKKTGNAINSNFADNFICEEDCRNITVTSNIRAYYLGTCIGFDFHKIKYGDNKQELRLLNLFEDKSRNLNGFVLRAFVYEILPFLKIDIDEDGNIELRQRDGLVWKTMSEQMNFQIDYSAVRDTMKKPFRFDFNVQYIFDYAKRFADLLLVPVYQFDVIVVEVDYTVPYKESGVCIISHRADFQTVLFDQTLITNNYELIFQFLTCFTLLWLAFFIFNVSDRGNFTLDQAGIALMNTFRTILSISLYRPPRKKTFRIVIGVSIWCYFVINFAVQAAIISFFSVYKRGKEVDTFEDVIEKGYLLEGMASPDIILPEDEERFQIINAKLIPVDNMFKCVELMRNDSRRFCLNDCAVARYFARNKLDDKGEQYLYIAKDRIHSHYLNMFFHKHSALTDTYNKYILRLVESGIIKKWEEYRYNNIKESTPVMALTLSDLWSIFQTYGLLLFVCCFVFVTEISLALVPRLIERIKRCHKRRVLKKKLKLEKQLGIINLTNSSTQTS